MGRTSPSELLSLLNSKSKAERQQGLEKMNKEYQDHPEQLGELVESGIIHTLHKIIDGSFESKGSSKSEDELSFDECVALRLPSLKLIYLLSQSYDEFPDTSQRLIFDSLLGLLFKVSSSFDFTSNDEQIVSIASLRNFALSPEAAVRFMLIGGIPLLFTLMYHKNQKISAHAIASLANLCLTDTVQNLISQTLREKETDLKHLLNTCRSKEISDAFFAASCICFLLMSPQNTSILLGLRALYQLRAFCDRDPLDASDNFFFSKKTAKRYCYLMSSQIPEVLCFFTWFVARFSSTNAMINPNEVEMTKLWRGHLSPSLGHLSRHPTNRIRTLAKIALINIVDLEYQNFQSVEAWLKTIELPDGGSFKKIVKDLEGLDMDLLLDPDLDKQSLENLLDVKNPAIKLKLYLSLQRIRKRLDEAASQLSRVATTLSSFESATTSKKDVASTENSLVLAKNDQNPAYDIFISYSWSNKPVAVKLKSLLDTTGLRCWMDESMLEGGDQLFAIIDEGLSNAKVVLACVSNIYGSSENCKREIRLAADRGKIIIPVLVGETKPWPPRGEMGPLLAGKLYVDISTEEKFEIASQQLLRALQRSV